MESKLENQIPVLSEAEGSNSTDWAGAALRIDLRDKVTGMAHYIEDMPDLPATAYGATLLSPFEETIYQDGQFQNGDPFQYRLPLMKDIPEEFHSSMLEKGDGPGPFGSKGMAQTSIVTVGPAIGNAIYDALGVRVRSLPITPEKVLRALGKI